MRHIQMFMHNIYILNGVCCVDCLINLFEFADYALSMFKVFSQ